MISLVKIKLLLSTLFRCKPKSNIKKAKKRGKTSAVAKDSVICYGIFPSHNSNKLLCVVSSLEEATEAIGRFTYYNNYDHFKSWCVQHVKDDTKIPSYTSELWNEYLTSCLDPDDPKNIYSIAKMHLSAVEVASMMRMFYNCVPLDFSFAAPEEEPMYITSLDITKFDPLYLTLLKSKGYEFSTDELKIFQDNIDKHFNKPVDPNHSDYDDHENDNGVDSHILN